MPKIKALIEQIEDYKKVLQLKRANFVLPYLKEGIKKYQEWRKIHLRLQALQEKLNQLSQEYYKTKDKSVIKKTEVIKKQIKVLKKNVKELEKRIGEIEIMLPNWIDGSVPAGYGDEDEKALSYVGVPKVWEKYESEFKKNYPQVDYQPIAYKPFHHYDLVGRFIDQKRAGEVAISRFYYEFDEIVLLDFAITMYAIEFFRKKHYGDKLMIPPYLMRKSVEENITYFEAFKDTIFEVEKNNLVLIPTSEHPIVAYYKDRIFSQDNLPKRIMAWSPSFRREAGTHNKDTRGIFRVRQFHKLELHSILKKGEDIQEMKRVTKDVQDFLLSLGLPNRSVIVPSGDMDKRALKQIDIETWFPGQGKFRETHSIATVGTWISEKLKLRYKLPGGKKEFTRNLYSTGAVSQRLICAIAENGYSPEHREIVIPDPLKKYMMGVTKISLVK